MVRSYRAVTLGSFMLHHDFVVRGHGIGNFGAQEMVLTEVIIIRGWFWAGSRDTYGVENTSMGMFLIKRQLGLYR